VDHRRPSDRSAGLCRTLRPARTKTVRREAGRQPLQFDPSRRRHYVPCVWARALMLATHALPRPTTGRLSGPRGPAFMEAAWKRQKEGDRSSASAPDPRIPCVQPESAAGGSRRKQAETGGSSLLAHGMQEVVGSSPTSSIRPLPFRQRFACSACSSDVASLMSGRRVPHAAAADAEGGAWSGPRCVPLSPSKARVSIHAGRSTAARPLRACCSRRRTRLLLANCTPIVGPAVKTCFRVGAGTCRILRLARGAV
jgi:hypothetical protein